MDKKFVNIGVRGYDVRIANKHEWFDHILEGYCTLDLEVAVPVPNYFTNQPVAMMRKKEWLLRDGVDASTLTDNLKLHGWGEEDPQESTYYTMVFTHPDHWGHEIVVIKCRGTTFVTDRHGMELNHE